MEEKQINLEGNTLYYRVTGQGPAVVLVHGFGEEGTVWKNQYGALPGFRLLIPDLPGSGRSGMQTDMSMEGLAGTLNLLLQQEGIKSCIMIGHSMGGYITLAFAEAYSHLLQGFGLFHSTAFPDTEEKKETRRKGIGFIERNGAIEFLRSATPNLYAPITKKEHPEIIDGHIASVHNFSASALVSYYRSMIGRPDRTDILKKTSLPVLFIFGRYDTAVPLESSLPMAHMPELSYIHILEHSGHMGMIEEAAEANRILLHYLNSVKTTQPE